jgi:hypothetical protein
VKRGTKVKFPWYFCLNTLPGKCRGTKIEHIESWRKTKKLKQEKVVGKFTY